MFWFKTTILAVALAFAAPLTQAQQVTLSSSGERLETLVPKLAAASGARLTADKTTFGEVVVLEVKDADLSIVKQKIAEVTGFVWVENGETSVLVRTVDAIKAAKEGYAAWSAKWMKESAAKLDEVKAADEKYQPSIPSSGGRAFLGREVKNAFGLIMRDFDFRQIGGMEVGERKVFSTFRTLTQVPFDNTSHRWAVKAHSDLIGCWRLIANGPNYDDRARAQAAQSLEIGVKKSILVARRTSPTSVTLTYQILNGAGAQVGSASTQLSLAAVQRPDLPKVDMQGLGPVNREMLRALSGLSMDVREEGQQPFLTTEVGSAYADRVLAAVAAFNTVDPIAWAAGDYFAKAKPQGTNLVACVSDVAASAVARARNNGSDVWFVLGLTGTDVTLKDGWLLAKPASTYAAWQGRIERNSFVRMFNSLKGTNGLLSLETMLDFVNAQPAWVDGSRTWETALVAAVWGQQQGGTLAQAEGTARDALAFYWASRERLAGNQRVQDRATAFMPRSLLGSYLFNDDTGPTRMVQVSVQSGPTPEIMRGARSIELVATTSTLTELAIGGQLAIEQGSERTEMLPNGIEFDGQLTASLQPSPSLLLVDGLTGGVVTMSLPEYAMMLAQAHYPQSSTVIDPSRYTRMAMIERQVFNYIYRPTENTVMSGSLQGAKMAGQIGVYASLPTATKTQIENLKQTYIKELASRGRSSVPVPPTRATGGRGGGD